MALQAVTFDFWNTLIRADDSNARQRRIDAWQAVLAGSDRPHDADAITAAMRHAGGRFDVSWRANRAYGAADAVDDMAAHLGVALAADDREALISAITEPDPANLPRPADGAADAIQALRTRGIRVGIVCDVGLTPSTTLRRYLDGHGMLDLFDHVSFSDEVGTFKPDPVIFRHALAGLGGADPGRAAHIGDLRRTDIAGALAMGMRAVRYAGIYDDPGTPADGSDQVEADAIIGHHMDLLAALDV